MSRRWVWRVGGAFLVWVLLVGLASTLGSRPDILLVGLTVAADERCPVALRRRARRDRLAPVGPPRRRADPATRSGHPAGGADPADRRVISTGGDPTTGCCTGSWWLWSTSA